MRKIFYEDIHVTDFEATVISCEPTENFYRVLLDATAFFPEEGGQSADIGTIDGQDVLDVQIENDLIYHTVKNLIPVKKNVSCHVDWAQRFDFMQQHSGEHIISGIVHERFGYQNVGFHLSNREVTMDFDGVLTPAQLRDIELAANHVVWSNLPIEISYPSGNELALLSYRSKIEIDGQVRIVTIPGVDICACCAPHVDTTGQIGLIKISSCQSYKGGIRLTILCGQRALNDYTVKLNQITTLSQAMSVKQEQVIDAFEKLRSENQTLTGTVHSLEEKCLSMALSTLPSPDTSRHAILFTDITDNVAVRNTVNELTSRYDGYCVAFFGEEGNYRFILGSSKEDCNEMAQQFRTSLGAKCGGNSLMIQGTVASSKEELLSLFA